MAGPELSRNKRAAAREAISNQPHSWDKAATGWLAKIRVSDACVKGATSDTAAKAARVRKFPNIFNIIWLHVWTQTLRRRLTACSYICTPEWMSGKRPTPLHFLQICVVSNCWPPKLVYHCCHHFLVPFTLPPPLGPCLFLGPCNFPTNQSQGPLSGLPFIKFKVAFSGPWSLLKH